MSEAFNPYLKWLGIPADEQPADFYRLLGINRFTDDAEVIQNAADRQMAHLRNFQMGDKAKLSQRLLNEIAAAKICLLDDARRAEYDSELSNGGLSVADEPFADEASPQPAIESNGVEEEIADAGGSKQQPVGEQTAIKRPSVDADSADAAVSIGGPRTVARRSRVARKKFDPAPIVAAVGIGFVLICGAIYAIRSAERGEQPGDQKSVAAVAAAGSNRSTRDRAAARTTRPVPQAANGPLQAAPAADSESPPASDTGDNPETTGTDVSADAVSDISNPAATDKPAADNIKKTNPEDDRFDGGFKLSEPVSKFPPDKVPFKPDPDSPQDPDSADKPLVDKPAVDEPAVVVNPAELLARRGLTRERERWIASEELELRKQMKNLKVLEDKFRDLSSLFATRGRRLVAMKSQLAQARERLEDLPSDRDSDRESRRGSRGSSSKALRKSLQKVVDNLDKQVPQEEAFLEKVQGAKRDAYVALIEELTAADASIKVSNDKYSALRKDDAALAAIDELGDKQGPSPTLNSATFALVRLKKRFSTNGVPPFPRGDAKADDEPQ